MDDEGGGEAGRPGCGGRAVTLGGAGRLNCLADDDGGAEDAGGRICGGADRDGAPDTAGDFETGGV